MQNILVVNIERDDTSRNLFLRNLQLQHFLFREGELVQYQHIAVCLLKTLGTAQTINWCQFYRLRVGGLQFLLVREFDAYLTDVILDFCGIVERVIDEEIITDAVDVVHSCLDTMLV